LTDFVKVYALFLPYFKEKSSPFERVRVHKSNVSDSGRRLSQTLAESHYSFTKNSIPYLYDFVKTPPLFAAVRLLTKPEKYAIICSYFEIQRFKVIIDWVDFITILWWNL